jgi:hypothetical protein
MQGNNSRVVTFMIYQVTTYFCALLMSLQGLVMAPAFMKATLCWQSLPVDDNLFTGPGALTLNLRQLFTIVQSCPKLDCHSIARRRHN